MMKIFYSIEDKFPPYRVDIVELYKCLGEGHDLVVEWYMRRATAGRCSEEKYGEQIVHLPIKLNETNVFGKLVSRLFFWLSDIWHLFLCLGKPVSLIQVRDKYIAAVFGLFFSRIKGIPFVYWCSYPFPEHYIELSNNAVGWKRIYYRIHGEMGVAVLYRFVMRLSSHVFVQSSQMKRDIAAYGVSVCRMTPVPMGVPERLLEWAESHPTSIVSGRVVYLGTMASVRQLHVLIDAFALVHARYPLATLLMVGDGDHPHERLALEQQVAELGLREAVQFTGFVPIEDAWSYAASAAICISPIYPSRTLNCGSPTKLFEYMALGRPVVCNSHPDQTLVMAESNCGLCVEWGSIEFSEAIIWMLEHPQEAEFMGAKGPAWVRANRSYPVIAETVWRSYKSILGLSA